MPRIDPEHHDGVADAAPGGREDRRRPGELAFSLLMLAASLWLLRSAHGISGFESLSSAGAVPMAATAVMAAASAIVALRAARLPRAADETLGRDILPGVALAFVALLIGYGLLLEPLGFLPTSALFLIAGVRILGRRGWGWTLAVSLGSLALIWLLFRVVFSVLMPAGIVPEAEFIQIFRDLLNGGGR